MLSKILSLSGYPGLYRMASQAKNFIVAESLLDGKKFPVYSSTRVSALEEILMYTTNGDVKLADIFVKFFDNNVEIDAKSDTKILTQKFAEVIPDYDSNKVYSSDIRKAFSWYNLLKEKGIITDESINTYKEKRAAEEAEAAEEEK